MRAAAYLALAALMGGALAACNSTQQKGVDSDTVTVEETAVEIEQEPAQDNQQYGQAFFDDAAKESATPSDTTWVKTASGLKYTVLKEGTGISPKATDNVTVHYTGRLLDGTVFDSSVDRGAPLTFALNQVIAGWTEGLQLMKEGGKDVFYLPSDIAYGETGTPGGPIPPNAPLIFEVELIKVN